MPMGLNARRRRRRKRAHYILTDIKAKFDDDEVKWIKSIPSRSAKNTLRKQISNAFQKRKITRRTGGSLRLNHFLVLFQHERAAYGTLKGLLVSLLRFYVASNMLGVLDEFVDSQGNLLAWTQTVVYGNTLRAMWFYTSTSRAKSSYVWFASLRLSVLRCMKLNHVDVVDLGPSANAEVASLKQKFGFEKDDDWIKRCYLVGGQQNATFTPCPDLPGVLLSRPY